MLEKNQCLPTPCKSWGFATGCHPSVLDISSNSLNIARWDLEMLSLGKVIMGIVEGKEEEDPQQNQVIISEKIKNLKTMTSHIADVRRWESHDFRQDKISDKEIGNKYLD